MIVYTAVRRRTTQNC